MKNKNLNSKRDIIKTTLLLIGVVIATLSLTSCFESEDDRRKRVSAEFKANLENHDLEGFKDTIEEYPDLYERNSAYYVSVSATKGNTEIFEYLFLNTDHKYKDEEGLYYLLEQMYKYAPENTETMNFIAKQIGTTPLKQAMDKLVANGSYMGYYQKGKATSFRGSTNPNQPPLSIAIESVNGNEYKGFISYPGGKMGHDIKASIAFTGKVNGPTFELTGGDVISGNPQKAKCDYFFFYQEGILTGNRWCHNFKKGWFQKVLIDIDEPI